MLKMFQSLGNPGGNPEHWDANWDAGELSEAVPTDATCENSSLHPLLLQKIRPDRLFLEGGCGPGHWVKYFHQRGCRVVGIDFAPRAVARLQRMLPGADVRVGDIQHLPFADGEINVYYSGGVVEHNEAGPELALNEARRVISSDGWFLCSVPDVTPLREFLYRREFSQRSDMKPPMAVKRVRSTTPETPPEGMQFFQYVFSETEFRMRLENAGFEVVESFGYALMWGLMEIPGVMPLVQSVLRRSKRAQAEGIRVPYGAEQTNGQTASPPSRNGASIAKNLLKRALVREDRTLPVVGPVIHLAAEHLSNLRMYVARPRVN